MADSLFERVVVGNLTLRNRIFMSAAAAYRATPDGDIDERDPIIHYEIAKGGCALVPTGGVGGIHPSGRMAVDRPMFDRDERLPSFRRFAERIHAGGAAAVLQATHSGVSAAPYQLSLGQKPFTVSFYLKDLRQGLAKENRVYLPASAEEIRQVIAAYGDAAARARRAEFDAVQIHAAHDSMLTQWLSPLYNERNDDWGGALENRCRIHGEILRDMKEKAGRDFPVILKLGIEDAFLGGTTAPEGIFVADFLARQGNVDVIEVSQGLQDLRDMEKTSMRLRIDSVEREAYFRDWTKRVKAAVAGNAFVTLQGGLRSPALMEEVLEKGEADFVSMCRPYICEPNIVNRWLSGDRARARCISCNQCVVNHIMHGLPLACVLRKGE